MVEITVDVTDTGRILTDPIRRYVRYYLVEQEAPVTFDRLATRVAAWHSDCVPMRFWNESSVSSRGVPGG
jgi:hypothetical protein